MNFRYLSDIEQSFGQLNVGIRKKNESRMPTKI